MTRAQIVVWQSGVVIYLHSDGYPVNPKEPRFGVLPVLLPALRGYWAVRRAWEPAYVSAQVVYAFIADHRKWLVERERSLLEENPRATSCYSASGFGVEPFGDDSDLHGDVDYVYVAYRDHVEIRVPGPGWGNLCGLQQTRLLKRVDLDGRRFRLPKNHFSRLYRASLSVQPQTREVSENERNLEV